MDAVTPATALGLCVRTSFYLSRLSSTRSLRSVLDVSFTSACVRPGGSASSNTPSRAPSGMFTVLPSGPRPSNAIVERDERAAVIMPVLR